MLQCTLPISIVSGKFLGSRDRIIVAGNCPQGQIQVQYLIDDPNNRGSIFQNKCEISYAKSITDFEICSIPRFEIND